MDFEKERKAFEEHAGKFFSSNEVFEVKKDQYMYDEIIFMWDCWIESAKRAEEKLKGCVVVPSNSVTLTCEQLLTVLQYGAPDLKIERNEYSDEQMETEMSIVWLEDGHSGKGYYAYYTDLPEEGSINLDLMEGQS